MITRADDPRLQEKWNQLPLAEVEERHRKNAVVILRYPDDEGVRLNGGRAGAAEGPDRILYYLGRMVQKASTPPIFILEKYQPKNEYRLRPLPLVERHEAAERAVRNLLEEGFRVLTLGGGHDYGYPDSAAYYSQKKGQILNIDAHLDLRPVENNQMNSGTGFFRFAERFGGKPLMAWGIQNHCNAEAHLAYAKKKGIQVIPFGKPLPAIAAKKIGLSICLDAFQNIRGVSAPAMVGLSANEGLEAVKKLAPRSDWMGLYECAPRYDRETEDSARLAALFAYHFIHV